MFKKIYFKIRNNWKKFVAVNVISICGSRYLYEKYQENQLVKAYCLNAQNYGDLKISPFDNPRHVYVLLDGTDEKYRHSTSKYFDKYMAPILHSSGVHVDIVKISDYDIGTHLKSSYFEKELQHDIVQTGSLSVLAAQHYNSQYILNKNTGIIILGGQDLLSSLLNYLVSITNDGENKKSSCYDILKKIQFSWVDFGLSDSKLFKTRWSSYMPIASSYVSQQDDHQDLQKKVKILPKIDEKSIYNLVNMALGIACNGYQQNVSNSKDLHQDLLSQTSSNKLNLVKIKCENDSYKLDANDILCDFKPINTNNPSYLFQQVDIGNNELFMLKFPNLWKNKVQHMFEIPYDKDFLYNIKQNMSSVKYVLSSSIQKYKPPQPFNADIEITFNPCLPEHPCSACHTPMLSILETFYNVIGITKVINMFHQKKILPISPQHKYPQKFQMYTTHLTAKFKQYTDNNKNLESGVEIIGYPLDINSYSDLQTAIQELTTSLLVKTNSTLDDTNDTNFINLSLRNVKHMEIKIENSDGMDSNSLELQKIEIENQILPVNASKEDEPVMKKEKNAYKKIEIDIFPNSFNIITK